MILYSRFLLQAAICSPAYKVREFSVTEVCPYAITLCWDREDSGDQPTPVTAENDEVTVIGKETSIEVFPFLHPIPSSRRLFFNRRGPFTLEARYSHMDELPNQNNVIGIFKIASIPSKTGEVRKVRVKVRVNSHGIFAVSQAEVAEEYEKEVEMELPEITPKVVAENGKDPNLDKAMDVETPSNGDVTMGNTPDNNAEAAEQQVNTVPVSDKKTTPKKTIVKKKAVRYKDLTVDASIMQFSVKQLNEFCEIEGKLSEQDELEHRRTHAKNSVEEYVYEMRNKLRDALNKFATPAEHTNLLKALDDTEDWLYGEGENLHRQAYADRLDQIRALGNSIELRAKEQTDRTCAAKRFEQSIVHIRKVLDSVAAKQETYNHLTPEQLAQLQTSLTQHENWLHEQLKAQNSRPLTEDPVLKTADIMSKMQSMEAVCHPIINTPKPVVPPPPTQPAATIEANNNNNENCPIDENVTKKGKPIKAGKVQNKSENMDVD
ncbi:heat shock protein 110kDa [Paragonimus westermani]|uniref:Heat shock protein 110kDa n=1 Tax=Paragonimus westermani TaxID=34504 RepID=A0A5J4NEC6_9TREM|nr:heat shock protein 110kDa [Paragonimus westermani]